jgi:hypothetical protein
MSESGPACARCHRPFAAEDRVALISGRIMGDECTDFFYWCAGCEVYTIRLYRDSFTVGESAHDSEPIPRDEGDRRLQLVRGCPEPENERCRCESHRAYFGGWLD